MGDIDFNPVLVRSMLKRVLFSNAPGEIKTRSGLLFKWRVWRSEREENAPDSITFNFVFVRSRTSNQLVPYNKEETYLQALHSDISITCQLNRIPTEV